jgi:hypothetical protein
MAHQERVILSTLSRRFPAVSAALIACLRRFGAHRLLRRRRLALLLPLCILRGRSLLSRYAIHRVSWGMLVRIRRTRSNCLTRLAGCRTGTSVFARSIAGAGMCSAHAEEYRGATYQDQLFHFASPFHPPELVLWRDVRIYKNKREECRFPAHGQQLKRNDCCR